MFLTKFKRWVAEDHLSNNNHDTTESEKQRTCEVNRMGENSSFIFTCYMKTVRLPVYDFKLVWVVLYPLPKNFFSEGFTNKNKIAMFYLEIPFS